MLRKGKLGLRKIIFCCIKKFASFVKDCGTSLKF